jgi:hypothetical protein
MIKDWRKLLNEELHNLYSSPSIITMNKSRRKRWLVYVACREDRMKAYRILVGKSEAKNYYEDLNVSGRMILKLISEK